MSSADTIPAATDVPGKAGIKGENSQLDRAFLGLRAVGAALAAGLDLQHVLDTVAREMANLLEMRACTLSSWRQGSSTLHVLARYDPDGWWSARLAGRAEGQDALAAADQVLQGQRPRLCVENQPGLDPEEQIHMQSLGLKTWLRLPMIFQDRVMGLVEVVDDRQCVSLDDEELALVQLLANQAANAIENAHLYETIRRHAAELTTLNRIGQVITSILDLDRALSIIADHAIWLLDVEAASVILYDQQSGDLGFGAASGHGAHFVRDRQLAPGRGIVNWVIQHAEPLLVPDVRTDPRFFDEWDPDGGFVAHSVLCVPLLAKGRVIGAIEAINKQSGPFDWEDLTLLTSMAASAAIAIENARLYEQAQLEIAERSRVEDRLRRVNRALRTLSECHETLVRAGSETELLQEVCRLLVEVGGHRLAWIGFVEAGATAPIRPMAWAGYEQGFLETIPLTGSEAEPACDPMGAAIRTRQPCLVEDFSTEPACARWKSEVVRRGYGSALGLPLVADGQILGGLTIYSPVPKAFDAEEVNLLRGLANDLAFGLMALRTRTERDRAEEQSRRLYKELQDHASKLEATIAERTRELLFERDRTQAILEAVGEAVIVTDLEGNIRYVNPAAAELTGYTVEQAMGRSPLLWQPGPDSVASLPSAQDASAEFQPRRAEVVSRRRDGTLYDAAMTVAPLFDSQQSDRLIGYVSVQRDITPIKEAERIKDRFVSNVSHELRTPLSILTLISGNLDLLYDRLDDERRRKMVQDIRAQAQVLNDLIGDVLEISRIESGRVAMVRHRTDLAELAREEADKQLPLAQKRSHTLTLTGAKVLPVWGNSDQLRLVLRNLLNNAIKYTPDGGRILCECRAVSPTTAGGNWPDSANLPEGSWAGVRVADTGIGIDAQDLPHLYERFYRVKTQSNTPGTGLGLSIAHELIELHGGRIAVASTPGEGSIFAVYLPLLEE